MSWWAWLLFALAVWGGFAVAALAVLFAAGAYVRRVDRRLRERWPHAKGIRR